MLSTESAFCSGEFSFLESKLRIFLYTGKIDLLFVF